MKKLQSDDPRLTAYALGELNAKEAKAIEAQIAEKPALRREAAQTRSVGQLLCETFEREGLSLHPVQKAAIQQVGRSQEANVLVMAHRREDWVRGIGVTLAAAATITLVLLLFAKTPVKDHTALAASQEQLQMEVLLSPTALIKWGSEALSSSSSSKSVSKSPKNKVEQAEEERGRQEFVRQVLDDPQRFFASAERSARKLHLPPADSFVALNDNQYLASSAQPTTTVPVMAGRTSFAWVERFLRERGELPPRNAVRLEELVNYPDYAEAAHAKVGGVALSSELVPCPWNEDALLLGLLLQREPGTGEQQEVSVSLEIDESRVAEYRLLGFAQPDGDIIPATSADASHPLAAGNSTYVFYEIKPGDVPFDSAPLGQVAMKVSDGGRQVRRVLPMDSIPGRWLDSSDSFRTAATVAAYALVLRDSPYKGTLDLARVESLAKQILLDLPKPDPAAQEVLQLIIETRNLAGLNPTA